MPGRLVVRRIPDLNSAAAHGQEGLFDTWRFHAFFTITSPDVADTVAADKTDRAHAIIEIVNPDLKNSARAHQPSGTPVTSGWTQSPSRTPGSWPAPRAMSPAGCWSGDSARDERVTMSMSEARRRYGRALGAMSRREPGDERPLTGYLVLGGGYTLTAAMALAASARNGTTGHPVSSSDVLRITIATHRLSRLITKEGVTAPLRAPFTRHVGPGMASEVEEEVATDPTHHPVSHAVGELLTCPFCMAQWIATALVGAHLVAPRQARMVTAVLTAVAGADALHFVYSALDRLEEGGEEDGPDEARPELLRRG